MVVRLGKKRILADAYIVNSFVDKSKFTALGIVCKKK